MQAAWVPSGLDMPDRHQQRPFPRGGAPVVDWVGLEALLLEMVSGGCGQDLGLVHMLRLTTCLTNGVFRGYPSIQR